MKRILLITGPIGSGKSLASAVLSACGMPVYDCDERAKDLYRSHPELLGQLEALLGQPLRDAEGKLDKKCLAQILFAEQQARMKVNALVHPLVVADFQAWCMEQDAAWLGIESALFLSPEAGAALDCDAVLYVDAPLETRVSRIERRDACSRQQALERIRSQQLNKEDSRISHRLLNEGTASDLSEKVKAFYRELVIN